VHKTIASYQGRGGVQLVQRQSTAHQGWKQRLSSTLYLTHRFEIEALMALLHSERLPLLLQQ
jgi:hypothetical protein